MALEFFEIEVDERQESANPVVHFFAGAAAGTLEHCGMFPLDTIKTHMQAHGAGLTPRSFLTTGSDIVAASGVRGLFRGLSAVALTAAPAHALSFTVYETFRRLTGASHGHGEHHPVATAISGAAATLTHDALLTPTDAVKQRLQLNVRPYSGMLDCLRHVLRSEGFGALYAGYTTALTMNLPYSVLYYASYESLKKTIRTALRRDPEEHHALSHMLAGAGAGATAAAFTTPLDVAKTRLQTQGEFAAAAPARYTGMLDALRTVWRQEGARGLTRGLSARICFHSMSAALAWTTYEQVKHLLSKTVA